MSINCQYIFGRQKWRHTAQCCHYHYLTHNRSSVPRLSPPNRLCVCTCACVSVCVRLIIFPLHALLADNLITTFSDTLTYRSKIALRNAARFWQGAGLWDVCVGRDFLSFFFFLALFFTLSSIVSYLRRRCHREEERKWIEEGEKTVKFIANMKKRLPPLGLKWVFQNSCCICSIILSQRLYRLLES